MYSSCNGTEFLLQSCKVTCKWNTMQTAAGAFFPFCRLQSVCSKPFLYFLQRNSPPVRFCLKLESTIGKRCLQAKCWHVRVYIQSWLLFYLSLPPVCIDLGRRGVFGQALRARQSSRQPHSQTCHCLPLPSSGLYTSLYPGRGRARDLYICTFEALWFFFER